MPLINKSKQKLNTSTQENSTEVSRKGCLLLSIVGIIFLGATSYLLFYMGSTSKDEAIKESFRLAIIKCREEAAQTKFKLDQDDCDKSTRKFIRKFGHNP